jgi:hypothetical protein
MGSKTGSGISRREFTRRAALVSAAASLSPAELLPGRRNTPAATTATPSPQTPGAPKLSTESQAEVDSRIQALLAQYGSRLSDAQKSDLRRMAADGQAALNRLRAFPTANEDAPALYLKPLVEREKKTSTKPATTRPPGAPKNP